jgi:catechol 2,3-dioxygenase-like lactoylglutathione lyase family enzyme
VSGSEGKRSTELDAREVMMRKLVVTENITLDGVIDMSEGWFDPLNEDVDQSDITAANTEHQESADALLVGRNTFEAFRGFWPRQTDDPTGVSDEGGLRYLCAAGEFHVFLSTGVASGESTQLGFEVDDIDAVVADLRARGVVFEEIDVPGFEVVDGIMKVEDNYPSKGKGERGIFFRDSEGNLLAIGQPIDQRDL